MYAIRFLRRPMIVAAVVAAGAAPSTAALAADETQETLQGLVGEATQVVTDFTNAPKMDTFRELMKSAKGVFISPRITTVGFVVAGSAGRGVALVRGDDGQWSQPAFYKYKEGSIGLQAGGSQAAVMLLLMTPKGVDAVLADKVKFGAGASIAAGPIGGGTSQSMKTEADVISYQISEGIFAGVALSGGQIEYKKGWNTDYYGSTVPGPRSILLDGQFSSDGTADLRAALSKLTM